jgi:hypothetical protein
VSGQLHSPAALPPGICPPYPGLGWLGGPQSQSGQYGEVKIFYPTRIRTPAPTGRPARSQSLNRLRYPGFLLSMVQMLLHCSLGSDLKTKELMLLCNISVWRKLFWRSNCMKGRYSQREFTLISKFSHEEFQITWDWTGNSLIMYIVSSEVKYWLRDAMLKNLLKVKKS